MGNNFYIKYIDGTTKFNVAGLDPPLAALDLMIGYLHNKIIHTDGLVEYNPQSGVLSWSSTIRIYFNNSDGDSVSNTIAAGSVTLTDSQFAYCELNETDATVITVSAASVTLASASNFITDVRLVLGYRNASSDNYFPVALPLYAGEYVAQTTDATVTTLASKTLTEGKAYHVEARVVAREGDVINVATYIRRALVYRATGGAAVLQGADVDVWTLENSSASAWDCILDVDTNDVRLRITGDSSENVEWRATFKVIEI